MDDALIKRVVAEVVRRLRTLETGELPEAYDPPVQLVTQEGVEAAVKGGTGKIRVLPGAIVTPLARDLIRQEKIELVEVSDDDPERLAAEARPSSRIALGADHRGYGLKERLKKMLQGAGREVVDCGTFSPQEVAYTGVAEKVANAVVAEHLGTGIVIDGGGGPSAIVGNKVRGIRAVACYDVTTAKFARAHVDANLLCVGVGQVGDTVAEEIVATWLTTPFEGGKYAVRVREIEGVEKRQT